MLALLTAALFAASASGQLTTAMWAYAPPDSLQPINYTLVGSVVDFSSDRTTVTFTNANYTNTNSRESTTYSPDVTTLGGLTYVEYTATYVMEDTNTATVVVACSRANERVSDATCMQSLSGIESSMSEYCGYFSRSEVRTTTYTNVHPSRSNRPAMTYTYTQTDDFRSSETPTWCTNSTAFTEQAKRPTTFPGDAMSTWALILTAGTEKLSASVTGSGSGTGSVVSKTGGSTPTPTGSAVASGAAMSGHVPTLVGVGALAAFFL